VVILDLTVPGQLGGKETIQKLAEIDPNVKAVISSGYYDDPVMLDYKDYGFKKIYNLHGLNRGDLLSPLFFFMPLASILYYPDY